MAKLQTIFFKDYITLMDDGGRGVIKRDEIASLQEHRGTLRTLSEWTVFVLRSGRTCCATVPYEEARAWLLQDRGAERQRPLCPATRKSENNG